MNLLWVLIIVFVVMALLGAPDIGGRALGWNHGYGYYPSGLVTVIAIVLIVLLLTGRL
jgi:hypothetical protein